MPIKKRHILIVDNNVIYSCGLREHLLDQGFHVTLAENCKEGKIILGGKSTVDLVILDYKLPDGTGVNLLKSLTTNTELQKPPVILSSSKGDPKDPSVDAQLLRLPAVTRSLIQAQVPKPYSLENMDAVMDMIFHSQPVTPDAKTIITGDYRHPKGPRHP